MSRDELNRLQSLSQAQAERAPPTVVLSLPETIWTPEEWEKEDSPPPRAKAKLRDMNGSDSDTSNREDGDAPASPLVQPVPIPAGIAKAVHISGSANDAGFLSESLSAPPQASTSTSPQPAQVVAPPSKKAVRKKFFHGDECSICLNRFERGDCVRILPCGHLFHKLEVDSWLLEWKKLVSISS
jgi:hypothetical protein